MSERRGCAQRHRPLAVNRRPATLRRRRASRPFSEACAAVACSPTAAGDGLCCPAFCRRFPVVPRRLRSFFVQNVRTETHSLAFVDSGVGLAGQIAATYCFR